jgi:hypothetical protein
MKQFLQILIILCLLIIGGAQATVINGTVLLTTNYDNQLEMMWSDSFTTKEFSYSAPSGDAIVMTGIEYYTEGETINFRFVRPTSSDITGSVTLTSTGLFSGVETLKIDGGTTSTISYWKIPLYPVYPSNNIYYITTGTAYYYVVTDSSRFNFAVSGDIFHPVYAPFNLDTDKDAYIQVTGNPYDSPITQVILTPINSGTYTAATYFESIPALKEAVEYTNSTQQAYGESGFDLSFFKKLIDIIYSAYKQMRDFFTTIVALSTWIMAIGYFLFAAKILVGSVVLHLFINMVYCMSKHMGGVNDLWFAFLEIIDNERKLLAFYKGIFVFIKDLIKWW